MPRSCMRRSIMAQSELATSRLPTCLLLTEADVFAIRGLVILGAGAASLSTDATKAAADLMKRGVPVVAAPRPITGAGPPNLIPTGV